MLLPPPPQLDNVPIEIAPPIVIRATNKKCIDVRLDLPTNGNTIKPSATEMMPPLSGLWAGCEAASLDRLTVKVTFVAAEFAEMTAGAKTAVAPGGRPLTAKVIEPGSVLPFRGFTTSA
jgi:hypothetical protein